MQQAASMGMGRRQRRGGLGWGRGRVGVGSGWVLIPWGRVVVRAFSLSVLDGPKIGVVNLNPTLDQRRQCHGIYAHGDKEFAAEEARLGVLFICQIQ